MTLSKSRSMCLQKGTRILFAMIKTPRSPRICPPQPPPEPMGYQLGNILLMSHQRQSRGVKEWRMLNVVSLSCGSENQSATLTVKMGGSGLVQNPEFSSFFPSVWTKYYLMTRWKFLSLLRGGEHLVQDLDHRVINCQKWRTPKGPLSSAPNPTEGET